MTIQEIKTYMKKNRITQIELSEHSGIPLQTLRKIFAGGTTHPRIDTMQAIEKALGFPQEAQTPLSTVFLSRRQAELLKAFDELSPSLQKYIIKVTKELAEYIQE